MDTAMTSVEVVHMTLGRPATLEIRAEPGAPEHVLYRFSTGRKKVGESYPVKMSIVNWEAQKLDGKPVLVMDRMCRIYVLSE